MPQLPGVLAFAAMLHAGTLAFAGTVYSSRSEFEAALSGRLPVWTEDFESFPLGPVAVPTPIGEGLAEIAKPGTAEIIQSGATLPPSGGREWLGVESDLGETIQGPGGSGLGVHAIAFDYFSASAGAYIFTHSGGADAGSFGSGFQPRFVGWIGAPGEVLAFVRYDPASSGHILDDFAAYVIPAPGASLTGLGALLGGPLCRRSRRPSPPRASALHGRPRAARHGARCWPDCDPPADARPSGAA